MQRNVVKKNGRRSASGQHFHNNRFQKRFIWILENTFQNISYVLRFTKKMEFYVHNNSARRRHVEEYYFQNAIEDSWQRSTVISEKILKDQMYTKKNCFLWLYRISFFSEKEAYIL